jgi:hypothetical protein
MAEVTNYLFDYKEVAEALIKKQGIHQGLWHIAIEFGFLAQNIRTPNGFAPAAILPVQKIGLVQTPDASNMTVNAAEVNPAPAASKAKREGGKRAAKPAAKQSAKK